MNTWDTNRIAAIYAASGLAIGIASWVSGRQGLDIAKDAVIGGVVGGTLANMVVLVGVKNGAQGSNKIEAIFNSDPTAGMGALKEEAISLLQTVNSDELYQALKEGGVKVAPVPDNPSVVSQDPD